MHTMLRILWLPAGWETFADPHTHAYGKPWSGQAGRNTSERDNRKGSIAADQRQRETDTQNEQ